MEEEQITLRGLNEAVFCERLFHLMYAQQLFAESADTIEGKMNHNTREKNSSHNSLEGMNLFSMTLCGLEGRLAGKLDGVTKAGDEYVPIEDKNSSAPDREFTQTLWGTDIATGAWLNDFPQLVGQMFLLRENGYNCNMGKIYYRESNSMVEIPYREEYDALIKNGVEHCMELLKGNAPPPLVDSDKCIRCSMNWICLPDEINSLEEKTPEPRRLYPGRPDSSALYVTTPGSKVGKTGESISVWVPGGDKTLIPAKDIDDVCIWGYSQITTQALQKITGQGGGVYFFTSGGWLTACATAPLTKNIGLRIRQFEKFGDRMYCLRLSKNVVTAKISNQRTLLRRNRKTEIKDGLEQLQRLKRKSASANSGEELRGYEGLAAKTYWDLFPTLFNSPDEWGMAGRNRRPPKDAVNAMLSYGYALLVRDFASAITECGMDYLYGFFHSVVAGRPALALDLMEPYRPLIVDSTVLRVINEEIVGRDDFITTSAGVFMSPEVKKKIITMYENRVDEMITHPNFGYRLSYRRMIQLEARLLGKYISGETDDYLPLVTR